MQRYLGLGLMSLLAFILLCAPAAYALESTDFHAGLCVAPSGMGFKTNVGVSCLLFRSDGLVQGVTVWGGGDVFGAFGHNSGTIHSSFHPPDVRVITRKGEIGLIYERGLRIGNHAWVAFGAGFSGVNTQYTFISNITGLEYDGGDRTSYKPHASIALMLGGKGGGVKLGLDSRYRAFGGLFVRR